MINNDPRWIDINITGENTGFQYTGSIQVKPHLNLQERADAVRLAGTYTRGFSDLAETEFYYSLAFLSFHVIASPDVSWWANGGLSLLDKAPILYITTEVIKMKNPNKDQEQSPKE